MQMNKSRLENLSDGVFAIVMTLLIIEISVPSVHGPLAGELWKLAPLFLSYFFSFAVLSSFCLAHHGFFHVFVRTVNRPMIQLNILYLSFISLIPFSAHLLGTNLGDQTAVLWYGANIFLASSVGVIMFWYAIHSDEVQVADAPRRTMRQAQIRYSLAPILALCGIVASFYSIPLAIVLYLIPTVINAIPGSLNVIERLIGMRIPD